MPADPPSLGTALAAGRPEADGVERRRVRAEMRARLLGVATSPTTVGRYVVLRRVGAGGFGAVYEAFDPELDRTVALKTLRPRPDLDLQAMIDEGRLMARVEHPNVARVFDVWRGPDEVCIAMEFVEGEDLDGWLRHPRPWAEILVVFEAAGRGLRAAHDAGVLHRDFKPSNVLLADDGRVLLTDFGLARRAEEQGGTAEGTPKFMAPEQRRGAATDARADQFAFARSLEHALARAADPVPRRLRAAIGRATRTDPSRRWPTMGHLLRALRPPGRARWVLGASVVLASAAVLAVSPTPDTGVACTTASAAAVATLTDHLPRLREALRRVGDDAAPGVSVLEARLAQHAQALDAEAQATCARPRASACTQRLGLEFGELLRAMELGDRDAIERAHVAASNLEDPRRCATAQTDSGRPDAPTGAVAASFARLDALHALGEIQQGLTLSKEVVRDLAADAPARWRAEAFYRRAVFEVQAGDPASAHEDLELVLWDASLSGDHVVAFNAAVRLADAASIQPRLDADRWLARAQQELEALRATSGGAWDLKGAALQEAVGSVRLSQGRLPDARAAFERAYAAMADAEGAHGTRALTVRYRIGELMKFEGEMDEGQKVMAEANRELAAMLGPGHADAIRMAAMVAFGWAQVGDFERAAAELRAALGRASRRFGEDHVQVAMMHVNLGNIEIELGHLDLAAAALERGAGLLSREDLKEPHNVAVAYMGLAECARQRGELELAEHHARRALALAGQRGPNPILEPGLKGRLAEVVQERGHPDEARALLVEADAQYAQLDPDHPDRKNITAALASL